MLRTANLQTMPMTGIMPDHKPTGYGRHAKRGDDNHLGMEKGTDCWNPDPNYPADPDDCW